uniref:Uncharacterized protein n=1 Tax=Monopterus albus TaxID=43700 RepID=A0A3Q3ISD8_MONAL
ARGGGGGGERAREEGGGHGNGGIDYIIKEKTVLLQKKDSEGFGFVLRGAKAQTPIEEFTPTPAFPALQYLESVDEGGVAWRAGLRMGDFLIEVNGQNVVKVGHRQVVNMIRQGGNSLMVKVVMVARNPELEDTARKRAPQQSKRLTPPAIALRSKSMTSELEDMGKITERTKGSMQRMKRRAGKNVYIKIRPLHLGLGSFFLEGSHCITEEERQYLHPPAMKLARSLSVPGPEEIPPPPNTSAPDPPLSAGPHPGRGPAMPIPPVSQGHFQPHSQPGHPTQAGWDRGGPGGMNQQVMVPTLRRQSEGLCVRDATPPTSAKGTARRGGRGALMKQSKVEDGLRQHRGKGGAAKDKSSIPIPTIIVKAPSTSSSGRSSQGSSMEAELSQDVEDLPSADATPDREGGGTLRARIQPLQASHMEVPTPRLRPSKSIDEGMFSGDSYINYSSSMPPAFGLPEYSSPVLGQDGQPKSAPSVYGTQPATTFIHPLTGKVLDPSSPLGLALAARERALKDDRRTRREERHFGRQLSTVGAFPTPVQTPTSSLFATPTQSAYNSPVSVHLSSPTTIASPASLSRPQSPRILRLGGGGERMEREKEGGPREGLRVRFSEDRTSQYSTQYYPPSPREREREKEVYDSRPAPPIQPPPPPAQPAPRRPSFSYMESVTNTSYIPQYTVPTAPAERHEAMGEGRAGEGGSLGLMVLPPPAPSIDADDEFVFADPLPPPLQFANGKNERVQHHQHPSQRSAAVASPPPPPLPSPKTSNAHQPSSQGGDSAASSLTSYDSESGDWQDAVVDSGIEELDSHSSSDHHLEILGLSGLRGERGGVGGDGQGGEGEKSGRRSRSKMEDGFSSALASCLERPMDTRSGGWGEAEEHEQGGGVQRGGILLDGRRLHSPLSGMKASIINELSSKLQQMIQRNWTRSPSPQMPSSPVHSHPPHSPTYCPYPTSPKHRPKFRRQTFDFPCSPTKEMRSSVSRRRAPSPLMYNAEQPNPTPPRPSSLPILPTSSPMHLPPSPSCLNYPHLTPPPPAKPFAVKPLQYWTKYDVADWLTYLNLGEHRERFIDNEIDGSHLPSLTKDDFLDLGVTRVGHRMNIERALKKLTDR